MATQLKRNRQERRAASVYRVEPLFDGPGEKLLLNDVSPYIIEGELDGQFGEFLIVSVPESTPVATAEAIKAEVLKATGKRVMVIAHNTLFMRAVKLSSSEGADVIKRVEESPDA